MIMHSLPRSVRAIGVGLVFAGVLALGSFGGSAQAQTPPKEVASHFGPVMINQPEGDGIIAILIGLLLPAVQSDQRMAFYLEIHAEDMDLRVTLPAGLTRKNVQFEAFIGLDAGSRALIVKNVQTGQVFKRKTKQSAFTVIIRPDNMSTTGFRQPLSSSVTAFGRNKVQMGDGSVLPIPFQQALPAVQNEVIGEKG